MNLIKTLINKIKGKKSYKFSELLELLEEGTIEIESHIPEYRWKEGDLYHIKRHFRERFERLSDKTFRFKSDHDYRYSLNYMFKHPINGDDIVYILTEDMKIKPFKTIDDDSKDFGYSYIPYEDYPESQTDNDFYSVELDIPSGKLVFTGYELWEELGISNLIDEIYLENIKIYGSEKAKIERLKYLLDKTGVYVSERGCYGGVFKKDNKYTFTGYTELWRMFDEDVEEELDYDFTDEEKEIIRSCGEHIEDNDLRTDKVVLLFDHSKLPENVNDSDYKVIDVEPGRYRIKHNIYYYQDDIDKRCIEIEKIDE